MKKLLLLSLFIGQAYCFDYYFHKEYVPSDIDRLGKKVENLQQEADELIALPERTPEQESKLQALNKIIKDAREKRLKIIDQYFDRV